MAEGHAVRRWQRALEALVNAPLVEVHLPKRWAEITPNLVGQCLTRVEARGKHLLLYLTGDWVIHCHAMQYGSWQVGERGMELRKAAQYVRLRLVTPTHEAVFYHGPVVEVLRADEVAAHPKLAALGPDVLDDHFDRDEAWARTRAQADRPIGEVVLNQDVMAGIGNIHNSEGLFLARVDPRRPASEVGRGEMEYFWDQVIPLMRDGMQTYGPTETLPPALRLNGQRHWVYRRRGHACLVCGGKIE
ncbi:MAG: hypothetical protein KIT87_29520, partial [Anaerolineae bacterium]|nr:hypothetical protein [Anaerolineae bacterium]